MQDHGWQDGIEDFLKGLHPYDGFPQERLAETASWLRQTRVPAGDPIYTVGGPLDGLYIIRSGQVDVTGSDGTVLSHLARGNSFGERGLLRDGRAATSARATEETELLILPRAAFGALMEADAGFRDYFSRGSERSATARPPDLSTTPVDTLMTRAPLTVTPLATVSDAARMMRDARVSSLCVTENDLLTGIVTIRDLAGRVLADGLPGDTPVVSVMTRDPKSLPPTAIGSDVLHAMMELGVGHIPIADRGRLLGIVTQTDLTRIQATNSAWLVSDIAGSDGPEGIARATARIPALLAQLVGAGHRHDVVTRLVTDIADAATRRLLKLAEDELGPPPVPYLWVACGSQGRREQTGVSDQDNALIVDDAATQEDMAYFEALARIVCDGLNAAGYVYCPGDMMASNPRWRQPLRTWLGYFRGWIDTPNPEAQMLASVMFDIRAIGGEPDLLDRLRSETLKAAGRNSIFVAHMVANSLKHRPPLGLLRGFATVRSGEFRDTIDLKMNGVVPIVDLGRLYALMSGLEPVNTRARLELAGGTGAVSSSGAADLLDAYDLIAQTRLEHQAAKVRSGLAPDNHLAPKDLSAFERGHLRDAFVVVRTMQSAVGQGRGTVM